MGFRALTSKATDCLAQDFFTWSYMMVLLMPSPQKMTNACGESSRRVQLAVFHAVAGLEQRQKEYLKEALVCVIKRFPIQSVQHLGNTC